MKEYFSIVAITISACALFQCGEQKKRGEVVTDTLTTQEAEKHEFEQDVTGIEAGKPEFSVDQIFQQQVNEVFEAYLSIKDKLRGGSVDQVSESAERAIEELTRVDDQLIVGAAKEDWRIYREEINGALEGIISSKNIGEQHFLFSKLSYGLYKAIKAFGLGGTTAFYYYCASSFNNKGAYWLAKTPVVVNPYSSQTSACGVIKDTLR